MSEYISASEFENRCNRGDVVCILAQLLADDALGNYNLSHKSNTVRQKYIDMAETLIRKLNKRNLTIIYDSKGKEI